MQVLPLIPRQLALALAERSQTALRSLFRDHVIDVTICRHAAVDVQRHFCNAAEAAHIMYDIAPRLKNLGIDTDWIYAAGDDEEGRCDQEHHAGVERSCGGTWKSAGSLASGDRFVAKFKPSAFSGTDYDESLRRDGKKILIITGYILGACVTKTVLDACRLGYQVILLKDATNYSFRMREEADLVAAGALLVDSLDLIACLEEKTGRQQPVSLLSAGHPSAAVP